MQFIKLGRVGQVVAIAYAVREKAEYFKLIFLGALNVSYDWVKDASELPTRH